MDLLLVIIRINFRAYLPCDLVVAHGFGTPDYTNNFEPGILLRIRVFGVSNPDVFSNWVPASEVPLHCLLID